MTVTISILLGTEGEKSKSVNCQKGDIGLEGKGPPQEGSVSGKGGQYTRDFPVIRKKGRKKIQTLYARVIEEGSRHAGLGNLPYGGTEPEERGKRSITFSQNKKI